MWWRIWIRIDGEYVVVVYGNIDDDDAVVIYGGGDVKPVNRTRNSNGLDAKTSNLTQ